MSKATNPITSKFKCSFIRVANVSEYVAAQKLMYKLGFRKARGGDREVDNSDDIRFIYVNLYNQMFLYPSVAKGNKWRETTFEELSKAVAAYSAARKEENKASKKRRALRKWDATATKKTHDGCPVDPEVIVAIKMRDGEVWTERAGNVYWGETGNGTIVSYKVLGYPKPKRESKIVTQEEMVDALADSIGKPLAIPVSAMSSGEKFMHMCAEIDAGTPGTNPKKQYGVQSVPLNMWSPLASAYGALGLYNGSLKYGKANFANTPVEASIYIAAAMRHLLAWACGQEDDPADGVPNLGGVLANVAILLEARAAGMLIDDRLRMSGYLKELDMLKAKVKALNELHAGKTPKHYTLDQE